MKIQMQMETQAEHSWYGRVQIKVYDDGAIVLKQRKDKIDLTTEQLVQLSKLLNEVVRELT